MQRHFLNNDLFDYLLNSEELRQLDVRIPGCSFTALTGIFACQRSKI